MGFELFVHRFRNGMPAPYDRQIAEKIFNREAIDPSTPLCEVRYADGRAEIYGAEDDEMDGVMLAHFSGRTVLERVLELAKETGSLIFWPSDETWAAVTSPEWIDHSPEDMTQGEEPPVLVHNVDELIEAIGLVFK